MQNISSVEDMDFYKRSFASRSKSFVWEYCKLNNYEQSSISISGATFNYDNVILSKPTNREQIRRLSHDSTGVRNSF